MASTKGAQGAAHAKQRLDVALVERGLVSSRSQAENFIKLGKVTVDDVVLRLLVHPSVIVTREEERRIPVAYRRRGHPEERYREAKIERVLIEQGTAAFFGSHLRPGRIRRLGLYDVERLAFEE